MKLSEAIREGAKKREQCFGTIFASQWEDTVDGPPKMIECKSCAWGAALEGAGLVNPATDDLDPDYDEYLEKFDGLMEAHLIDSYGTFGQVSCPEPACELADHQYDIPYMVEKLNDMHHWTREQIASWLEGLGL